MRSLAEIMGTRSPLEWMRARAVEIAARLRADGWTEDERGLWSRGELRGLHLLDAVEVGRETGRGG